MPLVPPDNEWRRSLSPLRWGFREADEDIEIEVLFAQVLDLFAFDDLDAAVAVREGVAVLW